MMRYECGEDRSSEVWNGSERRGEFAARVGRPEGWGPHRVVAGDPPWDGSNTHTTGNKLRWGQNGDQLRLQAAPVGIEPQSPAISAGGAPREAVFGELGPTRHPTHEHDKVAGRRVIVPLSAAVQ